MKHLKKIVAIGWLLTGFPASVCALPPTEPFGPWRESLRLPALTRSAAYGNGTFVIVGEEGTVFSSDGGSDWQERESGTRLTLNGVTFGGAQFVAVGGSEGSGANVVLTSSDGVTWAKGSTRFGNSLSAVAHGSGTFVAVGRDIYTSTDAVNWILQPNLDMVLTVLAHGNGRFVAGGHGFVTTSIDGTTWSPPAKLGVSRFEAIAYGNDAFVAVAGGRSVYRSEDGLNWTPYLVDAQSHSDLMAVAFGDGRFCVAGGFYTSTDGQTWVPGYSVFQGVRAMACGGGLFVKSAGEAGIATSPDGHDWTIHRHAAARCLNAVASSQQTIVAVGGAASISLVHRSTDGVQWSGGDLDTLAILNDVVYDGENFLAVGIYPSDLTEAVLASPDGSQWTSVYAGRAIGRGLNAIATGNGRRVSVGDRGAVATSTNGSNWSSIMVGSSHEDLVAVAHGSGLFVATGGSRNVKDYYQTSVLFTSPDGATWTDRNPAPGHILNGVAYGNGIFVAVRWFGSYLTSTNGIDWQSRDLGGAPNPESTASYASLMGIQFMDGWFITWDSLGSGWASADLQSWKRLNVAPGKIARHGSLALAANARRVWQSSFAGPPFEVSITSSGSASEAGDMGGFTIRRSGPVGIDLPVGLSVGGTAQNEMDYDFVGAAAVIPAGQESVVIPVRPRVDTFSEAAESVVLSIQPGEVYSVGTDATATLRIDDSGHAPRLVPAMVRRAVDGTVTLAIELPPSGAYQLETSSDLKTWVLLQTVAGGGGTVEVRDDSARNQQQRFYRLK